MRRTRSRKTYGRRGRRKSYGRRAGRVGSRRSSSRLVRRLRRPGRIGYRL